MKQRFPLLLTFMLSILCSASSFGVGANRYFACAGDVMFLTNYRLIVYREGERAIRANWGVEFEADHFASCGFNNGHEFKLSDMSLYLEKIDKSVLAFGGVGDRCSDGHILMFNEKTLQVSIVRVDDLSSARFECKPGPLLKPK